MKTTMKDGDIQLAPDFKTFLNVRFARVTLVSFLIRCPFFVLKCNFIIIGGILPLPIASAFVRSK